MPMARSFSGDARRSRIAAAARPVIFIGDPEGEIGGIVREHACGIVVRTGDADALVQAILRLEADPEVRRTMGARARAMLEAECGIRLALERWRALIQEVGAS